MSELAAVAPAFIQMAHRIVWCTAATVDASGRPRTRILHPLWEFDGSTLVGWIATSPNSPKADDLAGEPSIALSYWSKNHDTCTADCGAIWENTAAERRAGWDRFVNSPAPVGYDPSIIPGWDSPEAESFGILRVEPYRLRVMEGSFMTTGKGQLLSWSV